MLRTTRGEVFPWRLVQRLCENISGSSTAWWTGWMLLRPSVGSTFRAAACGEFDPVDDDTWMRARGWALALGLVYLAASREDESMGALGRATIEAALNEHF
jgi:hypothetical protein